MNQQVKPSTQAAPQAGVTPPEITALRSQETVAANISEIFADQAQGQPPTESISPVVPIKETVPEPEPKSETPPASTVEINAGSQPTETFAKEAPAPSETTETAADNLLINPLEPVIEQPLSVIPHTKTVAAEYRAVQGMLKNSEFVGAEETVVDNRKKDTQNISLS